MLDVYEGYLSRKPEGDGLEDLHPQSRLRRLTLGTIKKITFTL